jgi:hypothetical protein
MPPGQSSDIYQLKITLRESRPPVWRRVQVAGDATLYKLHEIIQVVMGWGNYHLHEFVIEEERYGEPYPDYDFEVEDEKKVKLSDVVLGEGDRFIYVYDFGDNWEHEIKVEKALPPEPGIKYPRLLKGKRACPPEDVGGVWGYEEFLEAIRDPGHPEHKEMLEWIGGEFDPDEFDKDEINRALRKIR